jgi:hypothetical protein
MEVIMNETVEQINEEKEDLVVEIDDKSESDEKVTQQNSQEKPEDEQTIVRDEQPVDEHEAYGEKVQKRINELTARRKQAEEDTNNAINWAKSQKEENDQLKQQLETYTKAHTSEFDTRVTSQESQVKQLLKEAVDAQDADKIAEATGAMANIAIEKERLRRLKLQQEQNETVKKDEGKNNQENQIPQQVNPQEALQNNPKALEWIKKNDWYGKDKVMSTALMQVDQEVLNLGYSPTSDEYFSEIDRRMADYFPQKFQVNNKSVQTVAPANGRASAKTGRKQKVVLSESERRIADKMGVPYEAYAKQKAKLESGKGA